MHHEVRADINWESVPEVAALYSNVLLPAVVFRGGITKVLLEWLLVLMSWVEWIKVKESILGINSLIHFKAIKSNGVSTYHQEIPILGLSAFCLLESWYLHGEAHEEVYYAEFEDYYDDEQCSLSIQDYNSQMRKNHCFGR